MKFRDIKDFDEDYWNAEYDSDNIEELEDNLKYMLETTGDIEDVIDNMKAIMSHYYANIVNDFLEA